MPYINHFRHNPLQNYLTYFVFTARKLPRLNTFTSRLIFNAINHNSKNLTVDLDVKKKMNSILNASLKEKSSKVLFLLKIQNSTGKNCNFLHQLKSILLDQPVYELHLKTDIKNSSSRDHNVCLLYAIDKKHIRFYDPNDRVLF